MSGQHSACRHVSCEAAPQAPRCRLLTPPPSAAGPAGLSQARSQLARDGKPIQSGSWGGPQQAEADGRAYLESVRSDRQAMAAEAGGAAVQVRCLSCWQILPELAGRVGNYSATGWKDRCMQRWGADALAASPALAASRRWGSQGGRGRCCGCCGS